MSIPNPAFEGYDSLKHAAVERPIDQEHQRVSEGAVEPVDDLRLRPIGDHDAGQSDGACPHSGSGMQAERTRDEDERGGPGQRQS